jgi:hypothetical protein
MPDVTPKQIEIFSAGTHVSAEGKSVSFSQEDIAAIASGYDAAAHEAPIVIGHPAHDAPAYGWIGGLQVTDGGRLVATADQVDPEFAELVAAGRYKKISASFYEPGSPSNPRPEGYYLRHVGFLGAQPPAIKGLKAVEFEEGDENLVTIEFADIHPRTLASLFRGIRDLLIGEYGVEKVDAVLSGWQIDSITEQAVREEDEAQLAYSENSQQEKPEMSSEELERREAAIADREKKIAEQEASFSERQARASSEEFIAAQVEAGRVMPAEKQGLVDFMSRLDDNETLSFSEGEGEATSQQTMRAQFSSFIAGLPKRVEFSEVDAGAGDDLDIDDPEALAQAAISFQEEQKAKGITVSTAAAVRHVSKKDS